MITTNKIPLGQLESEVSQTITNGVTDKAPSEDAVFDALALKQNSFTFSCSLPSSSPADSTTYYFGARPVVLTQNTSANANRFWIPNGYTKIDLVGVAFITTLAGSNENVNLYLRLNDTTDYLIGTFPIISSTTGNPFVFLSPNISGLTSSDFFEFKVVCPAWATNPTSMTTNLFAKISI